MANPLEDIEGTLGEKVGPFPVWGWGVMLGGVAVVYMWMNRGGSADTGTDPTATGDDSMLTAQDVMDANDAALWTGNDANSAGAATGDDTDVTGDADVETRVTWLAKAVAWEAGNGNAPIPVQNALAAYLSGKPITQAQKAIVNEVVAHFGLPPNTSTSAHTTVTNPPTPHGGKAAKPKHKFYTADGNDTITSVVRQFWGSASTANVAQFRRFNGMTKASHIVAGHRYMVRAR